MGKSPELAPAAKGNLSQAELRRRPVVLFSDLADGLK